MSKRNHRKDTSKLKNALAHGFVEGFGPMCNAQHPRKVKLPQLPKSDSNVGFRKEQTDE